MAGALKKHDFPLTIERLFTAAETDALTLIHFHESESGGFEYPHNWSNESATAFAADAVCRRIPEQTRPIEENTVPSWLWRRVATGRSQDKETSARQIFNRVAGAATYIGWKNGLFADETEARAFFDETRFLLAQRMIALEPGHIARLGLDWAYGIEPRQEEAPAPPATSSFESADFARKNKFATASIRNTSIDILLGGDKNVRQKWQRFLAAGMQTGSLALRYADIDSDWNARAAEAPKMRGIVDLLAFRREDGAVDIDRLQHATHLLVILLELLAIPAAGDIAIGTHNLAPLLLAQALPYDSNAGRATAAALTAVVMAEIYATSAQIAGLLGPSIDFAAHREGITRSLRNHRRAAYGDRNDYEKVSVLPVPLDLESGADLALIAAARRRWDDVLELVHQHGLRHARSDLTPALSLSFFMESTAQGIEPMRKLIAVNNEDSDNLRRTIHPSVTEALVKLGYDPTARQTIIGHIMGAETLKGAPFIDHAALARHGFDKQALNKLEDYLPYASNLRFAFTPWVLGDNFYRDTLKIPVLKIRDPRFNLLSYLGFSPEEIKAANTFCYGHRTAQGAKGLAAGHVNIFAHADDIAPAARIRMGTSVQSFISGDAGLQLALPATTSIEDLEKLLLSAWRQGARSVVVEFEGPPAETVAKLVKRMPSQSPQHYNVPLRSTLRNRPKAQGKLVSLKRDDARKPTRPGKS